ncbi:MAG: lysophospholipid acyltransferase family protein [Ignavibacteriales bacterium]|nr:lysophospholipid acyltransferase family protein [Ignavibacteriales bacterium]
MIFTALKILLLGMAAIPISIIALLSAPIDRTGRTFHTMARLWSALILWMFGIKVHTKGSDQLDLSKHYIYVSNHASAFDIPAVVVGIPDDIRFVLKKELTRIPIWGWALKYGHYITIDRGNARDAMKSLDEAAERMRHGASVILFGEGTRTRDGNLQSLKRGAFSLAVKAGMPVVPVTINNTFKILPRGSLRVNPADIEIVFDKPISIEGFDGRDGEERLMKQVQEAIARNYIQPE